jgi:hypothetical protein
MKNFFFVELAKYALVNKLIEEPAFAWRVTHVLRKHDRIIKKVKLRYWDQTHKYGILLPKSVEEELQIEKEMETDFWQRAIEKGMKAIECAFEFKDDNKMQVGHQHIYCHVVFDIKITLDCKARYVTDGHQTEPTKEVTFGRAGCLT